MRPLHRILIALALWLVATIAIVYAFSWTVTP